MSRRSLRTLLAAGGAAAVMALLPASAQAQPFSGGNYGAYGNEGQYPTTNFCTGTFRQIGATQLALAAPPPPAPPAPPRHTPSRHPSPRIPLTLP
ncbi:hypothetical protein AB0916_28755, partial [Streptomyces sp. NPDC005476]